MSLPTHSACRLADERLPTLFSKGEAVTYSLTDGTTDTLTATAGGRTVFTLGVNADGSWTFDLDDQLDHVDNGANDENSAAAHFAERRGWCCRRSTSRRLLWRPTGTATRSR